MKFCIIQTEHCCAFCLCLSQKINKKCVWSYRVHCQRSFSEGTFVCERATKTWRERERAFALPSPASLLFMWKSPSRGWTRGEMLAGCLSNLLYLISALNQDPQPATSVLQSQLHFSMQMAWSFFTVCLRVCVCMWRAVYSVWCVWVDAWTSSHMCAAWWVSSLFLVNPNS